MTSRSLVAEDLAASAAHDSTSSISLGVGADPRAVDGLGDDGRHVDEPRLVQGVGDLEPGQVDDLLDQLGSRAALDLHPAGEPLDGLGVVLGVAGSPRRAGASPPTGVLSSWLTLATKSRRTSSTRWAWVWSSTRSRTWADAERRDPGLHDRARLAPSGAARQLELGLADHAVAADLPGQVAQLGVDELPCRGPGRRPRRTAELLMTASAASRTMALERSTASTSATPRGQRRHGRRRRHPRSAAARSSARRRRPGHRSARPANPASDARHWSHPRLQGTVREQRVPGHRDGPVRGRPQCSPSVTRPFTAPWEPRPARTAAPTRDRHP